MSHKIEMPRAPVGVLNTNLPLATEFCRMMEAGFGPASEEQRNVMWAAFMAGARSFAKVLETGRGEPVAHAIVEMARFRDAVDKAAE